MSANIATTAAELEPTTSDSSSIWSLLTRHKTGMIGGVVFFAIVIGSFLFPMFLDWELQSNPANVFRPPNAEHWLGTDDKGRDVLNNILVGGRDVILVGLISAIISTFIAVLFGSLAAYKGGKIDSVIVQIVDFFLTIPQFALLLVISAYVRLSNPLALAVLLGLLGWAGLLRSVRSQVLSLKEREYVEAARLLGLPTRTIIFRDILPNMASYLLIHFIFGMTGAVYSMVGLYLLGLAPVWGANWGIMIQNAWINGALFNPNAIWALIAPLAIVSIFQLSAIWFTRSIEEVINPRLRSEG